MSKIDLMISEAKAAIDKFSPRIQPLEYKCLVYPEPIEETDQVLKRAKEAGIELASEIKEREQMAQVRGILISFGATAFSDWGESLEAGDIVYMAKYAGIQLQGADGRMYRLVNDKEISGKVV